MSRPRLLITSGPTREYLDPVRYLSNGSSGTMGCCLAAAGIDRGFEVTIVTGPVAIEYPKEATVIEVVSTQEMFDAVLEIWPSCEGLIGAAAPCDFRPLEFSESKIKKSADVDTLRIEFTPNPDILAEAGRRKTASQWSIGFALETENGRANALRKLQRKNCDFIVLNTPAAIDAQESRVEILDERGEVVDSISGSKRQIAKRILSLPV